MGSLAQTEAQTEIIGTVCKIILSPITSAVADLAKRFFDGTKEVGTYFCTEVGDMVRGQDKGNFNSAAAGE